MENLIQFLQAPAKAMGVPAAELAAIAEKGKVVVYEAGAYLFHESTPREWLGIMVEGKVEIVRGLHIAPAVKQYAVDIVAATRKSPEIRLGGSPRATLHLVKAARASAALDDRDYVLPDDVRALAAPVLAHRMILSPEATLARRSATDVVAGILVRVPVPTGPGTAHQRS